MGVFASCEQQPPMGADARARLQHHGFGSYEKKLAQIGVQSLDDLRRVTDLFGAEARDNPPRPLPPPPQKKPVLRPDSKR